MLLTGRVMHSLALLSVEGATRMEELADQMEQRSLSTAHIERWMLEVMTSVPACQPPNQLRYRKFFFGCDNLGGSAAIATGWCGDDVPRGALDVGCWSSGESEELGGGMHP